MFSNLAQNSIIYIMDFNNSPKVISGPVERVSLPRPKYNTFNPNMEMVVDITAIINGERREFKSVPNGTIADFGTDAFILAENKETLDSYINTMLQQSRNVIASVEKHKKLIPIYEEALQELNPALKSNIEKDKMIQSLQSEVSELKSMMKEMLNKAGSGNTNQERVIQ